jgi:hypothetical protein
MIKEIKNKQTNFAIIIKNEFTCEGIKFFTPDDFSQQVGYMSRPKGYIIEPHLHNELKREILQTSEVLFIKKGTVKVNFYTNEKAYYTSEILNKGDVILLIEGGHGFEILEEAQIIEVKQGPYAGNLDKTRF